MDAVKGIGLTHTHNEKNTHTFTHTKTLAHTLAGKSIHRETQESSAEQRAGQLFMRANQSSDNYFEIKYLLYFNAN